MTRGKFILACVIIPPIAVGSALGILEAKQWLDRPKPQHLDPPHTVRLVVEPESIDLGKVSQCRGLVRVKVKLSNRSDQPARLERWFSSCGCTVASIPVKEGATIAPGESFDFELTSDAWNHEGVRKYVVNFLETNAFTSPTFMLSYEIEGDLHTDCGFLDRQDAEVNVFRVQSRSQRPFIIKDVEPPVAIFDPSEDIADHELQLDWSRADEAWGPDWKDGEILIHTDHTECPVLHFRIQNRAPAPQ